MLSLEKSAREKLWRQVIEAIEAYTDGVAQHAVTPALDARALRAMLAPFDFEEPLAPEAAVEFAVRGLWEHQVHTPHPRYFGMFNPAPTTMGVAADTLVAAFNPQIAAWSHNPFAAEVEQHVIRALGSRFGYECTKTEGTFASGGMEANHTAVLTALAHAFPEFCERGVRAVQGQPLLYVSAEAHDSFAKAARLCGLGTDAVRTVPVDASLRMKVAALAETIARDRAAGGAPFLVVATAGTTSAGAVDPIAEIAGVAAAEDLWLHVDAAWGGAVALVPELAHLIAGCERADSITVDAHKWLSVPMGAGVYLTRHAHILERTFRVQATYMPRDAEALDVKDPYTHSMQWSRRFIGLKLFLSLAVAGWDGYAATVRHMMRMGDELKRKLAAVGWEIVNDTELPLACFVDARHAEGWSAAYLQSVFADVLASGAAWIAFTQLGGTTPALRACITNYRTQPADLDALVDALDAARERVGAKAAR
jgi:glutamate/tyrosine decarboxylase-like PLP-dependent enzyme